MRTRLRLPELGQRDRRAIRVGTWIVVSAVLAVSVIRPSVTALLENRAAAERERALLVRELQLVADAPHDRAMLGAARRALDESASRLFSGAEQVTASAELARYVGQLALDRGLVVEQIETETQLDSRALDAPAADGGATVTAEGVGQPLRVSLRARGDVVAIVAFLHAVEDGQRLVRVESIAVGGGESDGTADDGLLAFTTTLSGLPRNRFVESTGVEARPARVAATGRLASGGAQ
jgi:tRNA pseudouridine-54 N-methylase